MTTFKANHVRLYAEMLHLNYLIDLHEDKFKTLI